MATVIDKDNFPVQEDGTPATSPAGPAAAADADSIPLNEAGTCKVNEDVEKIEIADEGIDAGPANDPSPEEVQPFNNNDGELLISEDDSEGNTEEKKYLVQKNIMPAPSENMNHEATSLNDFDLLGSPQVQLTNSSSNINDVPETTLPLANQSKDSSNETSAALEPTHKILEKSSEQDENIRNDVPVNPLADPQTYPTEKKEDEGDAASHEEGCLLINADDGENQESLGECNDSEEGVNQSKKEAAVEVNEENSAVDKQASPPAGNEGGSTSNIPVSKESTREITAVVEESKNENATATNEGDSVNAGDQENRESLGECNDSEEGVNQSKKEAAVEVNEENSAVDKQASLPAVNEGGSTSNIPVSKESTREITAVVEESKNENATATNEGDSVNAGDQENQESLGECNDSEEGVNQSKKEAAVEVNEENSAVDKQASPPAGNEGGSTSNIPVSKESTREITAVVEESKNENATATNEGDSAAAEQRTLAAQKVELLSSFVPSTEKAVLNDEIIVGEQVKREQGIDQNEIVNDISPALSLPKDSAPTPGANSENGSKNEESDNNPPGHDVNEDTEERTEEEEEWLSMGLGLGDALRQIVALTEEKDLALSTAQEKEHGKAQVESLLVEVQSRLEAEMNRRAESESQVLSIRDTLTSYEQRLSAYETMEDDLEKTQATLVTAVSEKSKIELEVQKLREIRDASEQKEVVLSNRLNEAKKKEANKSTAAGRLEADNENLREDLQKTKDELEKTSKAKARLENNMEKLKTKAVERVKQAETALTEERELNEERKKKMKVFVETKAEDLREAKESANDIQKELEETRASLRSSRDREEAYQKDLDSTRLKHRELQRDIERMKRNSEQLHRMGNNLEQELEKSANETEEHKKKRMSAKHEIMQMVRTLEAERAVSSKLRESVKFTFTPKALSQQELLTECLREFQTELERLAAKTGKMLLPSESNEFVRTASVGSETSEVNGSSRKSRKTRGSKADMDTERLVSNLEQETQHVSKGIMALSGSIERMRSLLDEDYGCMTFLSNVLAGAGEARHQRLGDNEPEENNSDQFV